ncbi:MAG: hypothetical protein ACTSWZ_07800 [Candidatus Heimdallarchaeaceae archaeon]
MNWYLIVLGVGMFCLMAGLTIGFLLPRTIESYPFMQFYLFMLFVMTFVGIASISYGLKK